MKKSLTSLAFLLAAAAPARAWSQEAPAEPSLLTLTVGADASYGRTRAGLGALAGLSLRIEESFRLYAEVEGGVGQLTGASSHTWLHAETLAIRVGPALAGVVHRGSQGGEGAWGATLGAKLDPTDGGWWGIGLRALFVPMGNDLDWAICASFEADLAFE